MESFFSGIYRFFARKKLLLFILFVSILGISGYFTTRLRFEEDISRILPQDKKVEKLNEIFSQSKLMDKLVVMVSYKDSTITEPDSLVSFADQLVMDAETSLASQIKKINHRVDDEVTLSMFNAIQEHLPLYLAPEDYQQIDSLIQPATLETTLRNNLQTLSSPAGFALKHIITNDPAGISFIALKKLQQLQYDENFELYDNCVITRDHKTLLFFITPVHPPSNTGENAKMLQGVDSLISHNEQLADGKIQAQYFGATAVSAGNAEQLGKDSGLTQIITVSFLVIFIGIYFRRMSAPLVIMLPVLFGGLLSLACIYFIKGSISVIAIGTGSVILGIAVNYSLHVFNHYRHTGNMQKVINDLAFPLTLGGVTTIGGFFCLGFAASDMLKDLGLFAGFSLIGASLCSLIFLPHFITKQTEQRHSSGTFIDRIAALRPDHNKYLILIIIAITVVLVFFAGKVGFETDMNNMSYMSDKLKAAEARLNDINRASLQSIYVVSEADHLDAALQKSEEMEERITQLKAQGIVDKYSAATSLILSHNLQQQRLDAWQRYWTAEKIRQTTQALIRAGTPLGYNSKVLGRFEDLLKTSYQPLDSVTLHELRVNFLDDYINIRPDQAASVVSLLKVPAENKEQVYEAFENENSVTVLDKQYLTRKLVALINIDFTNIALITSMFVFTVLLITYGRIELALVSFLPMFISWIWILGIMGLLGIEFNIINIIVSTLIFGLGDDYSIFIMDGMLQEYKTGKKNLSSFKSSIILSAITTLAGLGVLLFAKHPALRSIAAISVIGILCVVLIAQVCIPFLFGLIIKNRTDKKLFPWTFMGFLRAAFANAWFIFGSILLVLIGVVIVKINPFQKLKAKNLFHVIIARFSWSLIYIMGNVKKNIINTTGETFKKPAVIIANHQSGLDNFLMMMLYPKMLLFTNDRVRHAPISGWIVQMADYYSATSGIENSIELIREKVKQGYSIVIFPEGTRSPDGNMKRFHKGAFYLAEQLGLDILPIVIHGSGYTMTKKDMLVKNGRITLQILPRIQPDNIQYGNSYAERAKMIGRYFRQQYDTLRSAIEQPDWFREQLFYNYIYKGPVLEWYMRVKVSLEKNYELFHQLLPRRGKILDVGCGYGFMSYMLHFASPEREIMGIDYDAEKTAVAQNCFSKTCRINFQYADVIKFSFKKYDGIIMADMLHYLRQEDQRNIIQKAIDALHDNGVLIIREGDKDLEERHKGTKLTEFFSTRLLGFNKTTADGLEFLSGKMIFEIAGINNIHCEVWDETRFTSNIVYILRKKPIIDEEV